MRYIFFLLLQLYIPSRAATEVTSISSRYKRRRLHGVRGRSVRRLSNIFEHEAPLLTFEARTMGRAKTSNQVGILDLPRKAAMIMRMGMNTGQGGKGGGSDSKDESSTGGSHLMLELPDKSLDLPSKSSDSPSKSSDANPKGHSGDPTLPVHPPSEDDSSPKGNNKGGKSKSFSKESQLSKKPKSSKASKGMTMDVAKPSISPSAMPATPPATIPTVSPDTISCTVDAAGNAGSMKGDVTLYDFFYQLEVNPGMTAEDVDQNLLKDMEVAMANALIPRLFPEQCGAARSLQETSTLELEGRYIGLSTRPPDFVLNGFTCSGSFTEPCYVTSGATTVYSVGLSPTQIENDLGMELQMIIQSGRLADEFDQIVGTTLLDNNLNPATPSPVTREPTITPEPTVTATPDLLPPTVRPTIASTNTPPGEPTESPTTPLTPSTSLSPTTATAVPTITSSPTFATRPPSDIPTRPTLPSGGSSDDSGDAGTPIFPAWAWTVLGVGLIVLCVMCIYLNRGQGHVELDTDDKDDKIANRYETQSGYSSDGDGYVPPSGNLITQPTTLQSQPSRAGYHPSSSGLLSQSPATIEEEPNRYLSSTNTVSIEDDNSYGDSEADKEDANDSFIPTNISLDPDAEGDKSPHQTYSNEDENDLDEPENTSGSESDGSNGEGGTILGEFKVVEMAELPTSNKESESESQEGGSGEGEDDQEEEDEQSYSEDMEESGGGIDSQSGGSGEDPDQEETEDREGSVDNSQGEDFEDENTAEEEQQEGDEVSEYDEESYEEESIEYEEESYGEQSYEEEVLDDDDVDEGEQSWLRELQQAQAGHYPSSHSR